MQQMMLGSGEAKSVSYVTQGSGLETGSPQTFSGRQLGNPSASRRIVVYVGGYDTSAVGAISGVSIGGVAATELIVTSNSTVYAGMWIAHVPNGTTGDLVLTYSSDFDGFGFGIWAAYGLTSNTPVDTGGSTADPATDTLTTVNNGFCIAALGDTAGGGVTWTNVTERFDGNLGAGGTTSSGADASTDGTNISPSGNTGGTPVAAVFATF